MINGDDSRGWRRKPSVPFESGMVFNSHTGMYTINANDLRMGVDALELLKAARHALRHFTSDDRELTPAQLADVLHVLPRIWTELTSLTARVHRTVERLTGPVEPGEGSGI